MFLADFRLHVAIVVSGKGDGDECEHNQHASSPRSRGLPPSCDNATAMEDKDINSEKN